MAAGVLALAFMFGGGTQPWLASDAAVLAGAAILLPFALAGLTPARLDTAGRLGIALGASVAVLALLHLVPLPPSVWTTLPGRAEIATALGEAGLALPWMPLSVSPSSTAFAVASMALPAALMIATMALPARLRIRLFGVAVAAAAVNVALGVVQISQGPESGLRFYAVTNAESPVGFFANRNHFAGFLALCLPLAAAAGMAARGWLRWAAAAAAVACVVGVALSASRAGFVLTAAGVVLSGLVLMSGPRRHWAVVLGGLGAGLAGLALLVQTGLTGFLARQASNQDGFREIVFARTLEAAAATGPLGTGFGSFRQAYGMLETDTALFETVVNQAHNDWVQLWLEGGVPGMILALLALAWTATTAWGRWRRGLAPSEAAAIAAAVAILGQIALHSVVDYPLRTFAIQAVLAIALGTLAARPEAAVKAEAVRRPGSKSWESQPIRSSRRRKHRWSAA